MIYIIMKRMKDYLGFNPWRSTHQEFTDPNLALEECKKLNSGENDGKREYKIAVIN